LQRVFREPKSIQKRAALFADREFCHYRLIVKNEKSVSGQYSESGMAALLHRLGYVHKKPKLIPGKADSEAQKAFLGEYE
ncbi:helix-turn-helix domain-containing protein, partial [Allochromatium vinosum]|uniref:helix-turn-helix domain-containing protein n=1 Tax=Allochromatium vinosum TaxID=1049 RepID=UPI001F5B3E6E